MRRLCGLLWLIWLPLGLSAQQYTTASEDRAILEEEAYRFSRIRDSLSEDPQNLDLLIHTLEYCIEVDFLDSASALIQKNRSQVMTSGTDAQIGNFTDLEGSVLYAIDQYDSSVAILTRGLELPQIKSDSTLTGNLLLKRGIANRLKGKYFRSAQDLYRAKNCYEMADDSAGIMETQVQLSMVFLLERDVEKAEEGLEDALAYYRRNRDPKNESLVLSTLSILRQKQENFEKGVEEGMQSLAIRYELRDIRGQAESLNNIAINYMSLNQWEAGIDILGEATRKFRDAGDLTFAPTLMTNIGWSYYNLDSLNTAAQMFRQAIALGEERNQNNALYYGYLRLSQTHEKLGNFDSAYVYLAKYDSIKSDLLGQSKLQAMEELEDEYESREQKAKMEALERENEILFSRNVAFIVAGVVMLIAGWVVLILLVSRFRKNQKLILAENEALEAKEIMTRTQLALSEKELEAKKVELKAFLDRVMDKERLISSLEGKVAELEGRIESGDPNKQEIRNELARMRILTDEDWGEFRTHFGNVYPNLIERLTEQHPDLSQGEIRIFLLMKLGLESAQMTNMLGVSKEGVKKARYRLRKRLGLEKEENMLQFIRKF